MDEFEIHKGVFLYDDKLLGIGTIDWTGEIEHKVTLPPPKIKLNEPVTFHADIKSINPDLIEMLVGKYHFAVMAMKWALQNRTDLVHRYRYSKRIRIRLKYLNYIIRAYKDHMRGIGNA